MKERPILFSAPMVRAILEGRKTQTRRSIHPKPQESEYNPGSFPVWYRQPKTVVHNAKRKNPATGEWEDCKSTIKKGSLIHAQVTKEWFVDNCPYGQQGDVLWVRETWRADWVYDNSPPSKIEPTGGIRYEADGEETIYGSYSWSKKTRPSIFMPRWASRITLEVIGIRIERLQDITEEDSKMEGVELNRFDSMPVEGSMTWRDYSRPEGEWGYGCGHAKGSYSSLWESINGPGSWDANPWVWVVEFKRIQA